MNVQRRTGVAATAEVSPRELTGVGGWLAFLVVSLGLGAAINALAAAALLIAIIQTTAPATRGYTGILTVATAAGALGSVYLAWRLVARQEPATPRLVIWGLWLLALVPVAIGLAATTLFSQPGASPAGSLLDAATIRPIVYAAIRSAYLINSDRVANTYAPAADRLADVFQ